MQKFVTLCAAVMAGTFIGASSDSAFTNSSGKWTTTPAKMASAKIDVTKAFGKTDIVRSQKVPIEMEGFTLCSLRSEEPDKSPGAHVDSILPRRIPRADAELLESDVLRLRLPEGLNHAPRYLLIEGADGPCSLYCILLDRNGPCQINAT